MITSHQYRSDFNGGLCTYKWHRTPCGRPREDHESVDYKTKAADRDMRSVILVYVDQAGASKMIEHILDGSLAEYKPSVTVGSSLHGYRIPMMTSTGEIESNDVLDPEIRQALEEFREFRRGTVGAGWTHDVTNTAWKLATALERNPKYIMKG